MSLSALANKLQVPAKTSSSLWSPLHRHLCLRASWRAPSLSSEPPSHLKVVPFLLVSFSTGKASRRPVPEINRHQCNQAQRAFYSKAPCTHRLTTTVRKWSKIDILSNQTINVTKPSQTFAWGEERRGEERRGEGREGGMERRKRDS